MRIITNISNVTDSSGTTPVVTYSNAVQTVIRREPNINPRICKIVICGSPCGCDCCDNMCNCRQNCCNCNANSQYHNSCCGVNNCCGYNNNCNSCDNQAIIYHYYCNDWNN